MTLELSCDFEQKWIRDVNQLFRKEGSALKDTTAPLQGITGVRSCSLRADYEIRENDLSSLSDAGIARHTTTIAQHLGYQTDRFIFKAIMETLLSSE